MTNFEWIIKDNERLKDLLANSLAIYKDSRKIAKCCNIPCWECLFCDNDHLDKRCSDLRKEWLNEEHEPLYKRGDIVIFIPSTRYHREETRIIGVVTKVNGDGTVSLTWDIGNFDQHLDIIDLLQCNEKDIVRKIGNILDNCDKKEA